LKTLFLLRHAMSQRSSGWDNDFERALTDRGRHAASVIGSLMRDQGRVPSLVIHSAAHRAAETWRLIAPELRVEIPATAYDALYLASPQHLFTTVTSTAEEHASVLIVGHNPGLHDLANVLVREGAREDIARLRRGYPAGALSEIQFDVDCWSELRPETGRLEWMVFPSDSQGDS
jgi:phosphohistidine phosphatase